MVAAVVSLAGACGGGSQASSHGETGGETGDAMRIEPGQAIGPISLGQRWETVPPLLGEPTSTLAFGNLVQAVFEEAGLELVLAGTPDGELGPESLVIAVGAVAAEGVELVGPALPNESMDAVRARSGEPQESMNDVDYYAAGWSVLYGGNGRARTVAVFPAYELAPSPPAMRPIGDL